MRSSSPRFSQGTRIKDAVGALREQTREVLLAEVQRQMLKPAGASDGHAVLWFSAAFFRSQFFDELKDALPIVEVISSDGSKSFWVCNSGEGSSLSVSPAVPG